MYTIKSLYMELRGVVTNDLKKSPLFFLFFGTEISPTLLWRTDYTCGAQKPMPSCRRPTVTFGSGWDSWAEEDGFSWSDHLVMGRSGWVTLRLDRWSGPSKVSADVYEPMRPTCCSSLLLVQVVQLYCTRGNKTSFSLIFPKKGAMYHFIFSHILIEVKN